VTTGKTVGMKPGGSSHMGPMMNSLTPELHSKGEEGPSSRCVGAARKVALTGSHQHRVTSAAHNEEVPPCRL